MKPSIIWTWNQEKHNKKKTESKLSNQSRRKSHYQRLNWWQFYKNSLYYLDSMWVFEIEKGKIKWGKKKQFDASIHISKRGESFNVFAYQTLNTFKGLLYELKLSKCQKRVFLFYTFLCGYFSVWVMQWDFQIIRQDGYENVFVIEAYVGRAKNNWRRYS